MSEFRYPRRGELFHIAETDAGRFRFRSLDDTTSDIDLFIDHQTKLEVVGKNFDAVCIYRAGVHPLSLWVNATSHSLQEMMGNTFRLKPPSTHARSTEPALDLCPPWRDQENELYGDEVDAYLLLCEFVGDHAANDNRPEA